jgi:hypothetical protein
MLILFFSDGRRRCSSLLGFFGTRFLLLKKFPHQNYEILQVLVSRGMPSSHGGFNSYVTSSIHAVSFVSLKIAAFAVSNTKFASSIPSPTEL